MKIPAQTRLDDASQTRSIRRMVVPNAMTMEQVSSFYQDLIKGLIIIIAVAAYKQQ